LDKVVKAEVRREKVEIRLDRFDCIFAVVRVFGFIEKKFLNTFIDLTATQFMPGALKHIDESGPRPNTSFEAWSPISGVVRDIGALSRPEGTSRPSALAAVRPQKLLLKVRGYGTLLKPRDVSSQILAAYLETLQRNFILWPSTTKRKLKAE